MSDKAMDLIWWELWVGIEIRMSSDYLEDLDAFIQKEIAKYSESDSDRNILEQINREDLLMTYSDFANRFYSSFFVSLYSFVEFALIRRCKIIDSSFDPGNHGSLDKYKDCLKTDIAIKGSFGSPEWNQVIIINKIRNRIVHARGKANEETPKRYIDTDGYIVLEKKDCEAALRNVEKFLGLLNSR